MDLINSLDELALASRLKRLSDRLMKDMAMIYREANVDFQPRWFTTFMALDRMDSLTITEIAEQLGVSHTAVNNIVTEMTKHGLVIKKNDIRDERRHRVSLTYAGRCTRINLIGLWEGVQKANADLLDEAQVDLLGNLRNIEMALDKRDMGNRLRQSIGLPERETFEIVDYRPAYKKHFASLNNQWLEEKFTIEESDRQLLDDPNGTILRRGGSILFAKYNDEIVGTCALLARPDGNVELTKMAVTPASRGRGVGRLLANKAIERARKKGANSLLLATSIKLKAALALYQSLGFEQIDAGPAEEGNLTRPSISMALKLTPLPSPLIEKE